MPWPTPITIWDDYFDPATQKPLRGGISAQLVGPLHSTSGAGPDVPPKYLSAGLSDAGHVELTVPASNDPDTAVAQQYTVWEHLPFEYDRRFLITIPYNAAGGRVQLSTLSGYPGALTKAPHIPAVQAVLQLANTVPPADAGAGSAGSDPSHGARGDHAHPRHDPSYAGWVVPVSTGAALLPSGTRLVRVPTLTGDLTLTLPLAAADAFPAPLLIQTGSLGGHVLTLAAQGAEHIDAATTITPAATKGLTFYSDPQAATWRQWT